MCRLIKFLFRMKVVKIKHLLNESNKTNFNYVVKGWVKTFRANRFIALNDGSSIENLQCVVDYESLNESELKLITTGTALHLEGSLVESQGSGQKVELKVNKLDIIGDCNPEKYPIQPKKHSLEYLREKAHLRIRTTTFAAVMRNSIISFVLYS